MMKFAATKKILKYMLKDKNTAFDFSNNENHYYEDWAYLEKMKKKELLYDRVKDLLQDRLRFVAIDIFDVTSHNYFLDGNGQRHYVRDYILSMDKQGQIVLKVCDRINFDLFDDEIAINNNKPLYRELFKDEIWNVQSHILGKSHINLVLCKKDTFWNGRNFDNTIKKDIVLEQTKLDVEFAKLYDVQFDSPDKKQEQVDKHKKLIEAKALKNMLQNKPKNKITEDEQKFIETLERDIQDLELYFKKLNWKKSEFKNKYEILDSQRPQYFEDSLLHDFEILDTHLTHDNFYDLIGWVQKENDDRQYYKMISKDEYNNDVLIKNERFLYADGNDKKLKKLDKDLPMLGLDYFEMIANCCGSLSSKILNGQNYFDTIRKYEQDSIEKKYTIFEQRIKNVFGEGFRLPFEIEWEYAAYGGLQYNEDSLCRWSGTNNYNDLRKYANFVNDQNKSYLLSVRSKKANNFGIYDMSGNAYDLCMDEFISYNDSNFKIQDNDNSFKNLNDILSIYEPKLNKQDFNKLKDNLYGLLENKKRSSNTNYKYTRRYSLNSQRDECVDENELKFIQEKIERELYRVEQKPSYLIVKGGGYETNRLRDLMISHRNYFNVVGSVGMRDEYSYEIESNKIGVRPCRFVKEKKYTYLDIIKSF